VNQNPATILNVTSPTVPIKNTLAKPNVITIAATARINAAIDRRICWLVDLSDWKIQ